MGWKGGGGVLVSNHLHLSRPSSHNCPLPITTGAAAGGRVEVWAFLKSLTSDVLLMSAVSAIEAEAAVIGL